MNPGPSREGRGGEELSHEIFNPSQVEEAFAFSPARGLMPPRTAKICCANLLELVVPRTTRQSKNADVFISAQGSDEPFASRRSAEASLLQLVVPRTTRQSKNADVFISAQGSDEPFASRRSAEA